VARRQPRLAAPAPDHRHGVRALKDNIAIIGAGISGLTCAASLAASGRGVTVFDKGRRPGGRLNTRRWKDLRFDHGAQFFTARDRAFQRQVVEWTRDQVVAPWKGKVVRVTAEGVRGRAYDAVRYVGTPGQRSIADALAARLPVQQATEIRVVARSGDRWQLTDRDGVDCGSYDAVVVAIPAPQAAALLVEAPTLQSAAADVVMAPCWAVLAAFSHSVEAGFDGAFVESGTLSWAARDSSKPGRQDAETWVLHASPQWSRRHLDEKPGRVTRALLDAFGSIVPAAVEAAAVTYAHRWLYSLPQRLNATDCLFDAEARIGACGDWCNGPRVEGAWLSGMALARRLGAAR
jgi:predicted NAD/FAD-dependent oxidoreductase